MPTASHQTIKLSKGKHTSPQRGACVMELASMLAGERFTDHPRTVSRAIAAFLRGYNDLVDHQRRQDLYRYAALSVGTTGEEEIEDARVSRLVGWADARRSRGGFLLRLGGRRQGRTGSARIGPEGAANYALRTLVRTETSHAEVLRLVDELIALGAGAQDLTSALELASTESGSGAERLELPALG